MPGFGLKLPINRKPASNSDSQHYVDVRSFIDLVKQVHRRSGADHLDLPQLYVGAKLQCSLAKQWKSPTEQDRCEMNSDLVQ